jgi:hypothetical protein
MFREEWLSKSHVLICQYQKEDIVKVKFAESEMKKHNKV